MSLGDWAGGGGGGGDESVRVELESERGLPGGMGGDGGGQAGKGEGGGSAGGGLKAKACMRRRAGRRSGPGIARHEHSAEMLHKVPAATESASEAQQGAASTIAISALRHGAHARQQRRRALRGRRSLRRRRCRPPVRPAGATPARRP